MLFEGHTRLTVDSNEFDAVGGDVLLVFPNQIHEFATLERENYILFKVNPELIPEFTAQLTSSIPRYSVLKGAANDEYLRETARKISSAYYGDEPFKETLLRGLLLVFISKLLQRTELAESQSEDYHLVGTIMNYCNQNYDKPLSLSALANALHLNKYYISHIMSSKLNIGFNDYINSLRVSNACKYLVKTDWSITEISEKVGFNTLRTFNRSFAKQMGCTPSEYRRKKKNEGKFYISKIKSSSVNK